MGFFVVLFVGRERVIVDDCREVAEVGVVEGFCCCAYGFDF